jgi:hypothetical protein
MNSDITFEFIFKVRLTLLGILLGRQYILLKKTYQSY